MKIILNNGEFIKIIKSCTDVLNTLFKKDLLFFLNDDGMYINIEVSSKAYYVNLKKSFFITYQKDDTDKICINGNDFYKILTSFEKDIILIGIEDNSLFIKQKDKKYNLPLYDTEDAKLKHINIDLKHKIKFKSNYFNNLVDDLNKFGNTHFIIKKNNGFFEVETYNNLIKYKNKLSYDFVEDLNKEIKNSNECRYVGSDLKLGNLTSLSDYIVFSFNDDSPFMVELNNDNFIIKILSAQLVENN